MENLENGLRNNQTDQISAQVERIGTALDQVLNARAGVGEKLNLLETTGNYWTKFKMNTEQMLYETEDVDITQAIADLAVLETAYQASLASTAKILQPSLIEYLK